MNINNQKIKLIVFDLDGVLLDAKEIHYESLNDALPKKYKISWKEHINIYDGLNTKHKLQILTDKKGLPKELHDKIWKKKQDLTNLRFSNVTINFNLKKLFNQLHCEKYKIAICSNSIRKTVYSVLEKLNLFEYVDLVLSNEDVVSPKPHPEMYWKAMSILKFFPEETLIIEDSPHGLLAATKSGANVFRVKNNEDLTLESIYNQINNCKNLKNMKWQDKKLNVLIPMAGAGNRFKKAGYTFPKPLIDIRGKPMIQVVVENLALNSNYNFIIQKKHKKKYNLDFILPMIVEGNNCNIFTVDKITDGAACTTLLAKDNINNDNPLIIANSDQYIEWNSVDFMYKMQERNADGGILTFESSHPKWSFVQLDESGYVSKVAEKNPISNIATVGVYYWRKGSDYVKYAEQMIKKNIRCNNEFYVCPVFNEAIADGKKIITHHVDKMWGLGTPEDLDFFLNNFN
jgi:HAD superfamily hydrolase (TIGR01509 family)